MTCKSAALLRFVCPNSFCFHVHDDRVCRTQCNTQILAVKEDCNEKITAAKLEVQKKFAKLNSEAQNQVRKPQRSDLLSPL